MNLYEEIRNVLQEWLCFKALCINNYFINNKVGEKKNKHNKKQPHIQERKQTSIYVWYNSSDEIYWPRIQCMTKKAPELKISEL